MQILSHSEAIQLAAKIEPMLERPNRFSLEWLDNRSWMAIPRPDTFDEIDANLLSSLAAKLGVNDGFAMLTELDSDKTVYRVSWTVEALLLFDTKFPLSNYILVPKNLCFALLKEASHYFIIAGSIEHVTAMMDETVETAEETFRQYANNAFWPVHVNQWMSEIADLYFDS